MPALVRLALGGCLFARSGLWTGWLTLLALSLPAAAAGFEQRLAAVEAAVDAHLSATTSAPAYPKPWRKILWFRLQGDARPDALVVLRPGRNECGAAALSARSCQALLLTGQPDGAYRVATEFALLTHPIALRLDGRGQVIELLYSRDTQTVPSYARYRWGGEEFQRVDGVVDAAQLRQLPTLIADDRNMALLEDQRYAARNFNNTDAWLAPYRLHYDAVAIARHKVVDSEQANKVAQAAVERLLPMVQEMSKAFPWSQTLEVRLWSCTDWMVPRRFWEVEGQRLGRLGTCIEPALIVQLMGGDQATVLLTLKQQLAQQFGMAMLMRTAPLSAVQRESLRRAGSLSVFSAAVAGMWMGQATRTHSVDQSAAAIQALRQVSDLWFEQMEFKKSHYVSRTPELRAFDEEVRAMAGANQCLRQVLKLPASKLLKDDTCSKEAQDNAQAIVSLAQEVGRP